MNYKWIEMCGGDQKANLRRVISVLNLDDLGPVRLLVLHTRKVIQKTASRRSWNSPHTSLSLAQTTYSGALCSHTSSQIGRLIPCIDSHPLPAPIYAHTSRYHKQFWQREARCAFYSVHQEACLRLHASKFRGKDAATCMPHSDLAVPAVCRARQTRKLCGKRAKSS